jgi:hypothetical protein
MPIGLPTPNLMEPSHPQSEPSRGWPQHLQELTCLPSSWRSSLGQRPGGSSGDGPRWRHPGGKRSKIQEGNSSRPLAASRRPPSGSRASQSYPWGSWALRGRNESLRRSSRVSAGWLDPLHSVLDVGGVLRAEIIGAKRRRVRWVTWEQAAKVQPMELVLSVPTPKNGARLVNLEFTNLAR